MQEKEWPLESGRQTPVSRGGVPVCSGTQHILFHLIVTYLVHSTCYYFSITSYSCQGPESYFAQREGTYLICWEWGQE